MRRGAGRPQSVRRYFLLLPGFRVRYCAEGLLILSGLPDRWSRKKLRNSRGLNTRTPWRQAGGKCRRFPVARHSTCPASATSTNLASLGSGRCCVVGKEETDSPPATICASKLATWEVWSANSGRFKTASYSARILPSKQSCKLPLTIMRTMTPGGPSEESIPETSTFVSTTIFTGSGPYGLLG